MAYPNHPPPPPPQVLGSANTVFITQIRFDASYLKTAPGILKIVVILLNLIGFICIQSSPFWSNGRGIYFNIVANLGFWFSWAMLMLYVFHIVERYHNVKWLKVEMAACVAMVFLYLIASTVVVAFGANAYSAAGREETFMQVGMILAIIIRCFSMVTLGFWIALYLQFFGYLAMVVYGVDAFFKARAVRDGDLPQGQRVVARQTHVTTPPALP